MLSLTSYLKKKWFYWYVKLQCIKPFCYLEGGESEENEADNSKENENEEVCQNFKTSHESTKSFERCI